MGVKVPRANIGIRQAQTPTGKHVALISSIRQAVPGCSGSRDPERSVTGTGGSCIAVKQSQRDSRWKLVKAISTMRTAVPGYTRSRNPERFVTGIDGSRVVTRKNRRDVRWKILKAMGSRLIRLSTLRTAVPGCTRIRDPGRPVAGTGGSRVVARQNRREFGGSMPPVLGQVTNNNSVVGVECGWPMRMPFELSVSRSKERPIEDSRSCNVEVLFSRSSLWAITLQVRNIFS